MAKRKSTAPKAKAVETEKDPEATIEHALGSTEMWFEKNWKMLSIIGVAVLILAGGIYSYEVFYKAPRGQKAADAMFVAQQLFAEGDWATALNGDGNNPGFIEVADTYGGTRQGRLAAHYAGICSMHEGDLDGALEYLSKYKASKGAPNAIINAENEGLKGDIYVQKSEYATAVAHFAKAAEIADNTTTTPLYLKKLGLAYEAVGDFAKAVEAYRRVATDYPMSLEARDIEKLAAAAEQQL
jgi:tetratricopeptide (TPR) repeat protein